MKAILQKYSTRLVNVSSKNRSLATKKLYKKRAFDIVKLDEFKKDVSKNLIDILINRRDEELLILEDPYKWYLQNLELLKETIQKEKNNSLDKLDQTEENFIEKKQEIQKQFEEKLQKEDEKLKAKQEELTGYSLSLKTLIKEIKNTEKETGRYELYIGYPFVEGFLKDKTFVKAPLFLFPVEVIKVCDNITIKNKAEAQVMLNKVFLIGYAKFNEEKVANIKTEYDTLDEFGQNKIEGILKSLQDEGIYISYDDHDILRFKEITNQTKLNYNLGELKLQKNIILGHFNIASSIYNDYMEMENNELTSPLIEKLIKNKEENNLGSDPEEKEDIRENEIKDKNFYFISTLDYSQEIAVKKSYENSNLVIYGPPGTGKSQTIVNIVSQYLSQGKKVLMVSQKKAALDVIFNRAGLLNSKMIMFNKDVEKKQFYKNIANRIDCLEKKPLDNTNIKNKALEIDKKIEQLTKLSIALTKKSPFGLTIQEMYTKPRVKKEDEDLNNFFKKFRREFPFEKLQYKDFEEISKALLTTSKIDKYYKLKELTAKNKYTKDINEAIEIYDIEDGIDDTENLINQIENHYSLIEKDSKYFKYSKEIILKNQNITEVAEEINKKENGYLQEKLTKGSKFSISYWINLKKNKQKEEENQRLYSQKQKEITELLKKETDNIKSFISKFQYLKTLFTPSKIEDLTNSFHNIQLIKENLSKILATLNKYQEISALKGIVKDINNREIQVLDYVFSKESNLEKGKIIIKNLPILANQVYIGRLQKEYSKELEIIDNFSTITKEISEAMEEKMKNVPRYINQMWDNIAIESRIYNEKLWKQLTRETNKKSRLLQIREFIAIFKEIIFELYPCWLLSPEAVSEVLPLDKGLFDVIIFDEASQMFIESAIPTIYRGNKVIVAGDDKQLRPSSNFAAKYEDEEEEEQYDIETVAALEEESLLDLAKYSFNSTSLYYHYRSKYDELINFSNYAFYGGKLEISPNLSKTNETKTKPIERIKVDGKWIDRKNSKEAIEVVNIIKNILLTRENNETIGVITFNITQRDLIDELLEIEAAKDPIFAEKYLKECDRNENNEDLSLFIKNIENVQGDERDIIIFSTAYAKNEKGRLTVSFGSLSQEGGENRLNVAISRAKKKIFVVTSIEPEELSVENSKNIGPKLFKKYLQYVKAISDGNNNAAQQILFSVCDSDISRKEEDSYDSDFENQVHDALKNEGLLVDTQIGVSGYKIDLAVYNKKTSKYILGIECDGAAYHSSKSARERDIYRQRYLEKRGWRIVRIWSKDWWTNPEREVQRIVSTVNSILQEVE